MAREKLQLILSNEDPLAIGNEFIQKASQIVVDAENEYLTDMLLHIIGALNRAEGCGCFQCVHEASRAERVFQEELERLGIHHTLPPAGNTESRITHQDFWE